MRQFWVIVIGLAILLLAINWYRLGDLLYSYVYPPEEEKCQEMINSVDISPWPDGKDVFVVVDVAPIGNTGIKNVIVERERDDYCVSAFSGKDIQKGLVVKLAFSRKMNNGNGAWSATSIIKEVIKTEKPN